MHRPQIMGIVNVTPDSFSDGGRFADTQAAIEHAKRLIGEGADIVDIGGESSRPGARPLSPEEEIARVVPVIEGLRNCGAIVSIDTYHPETMRAALAAGAGMINDIRALREPGALEIAVESDARLCLMHMQGTPATMQDNPAYDDVVRAVFDFLAARIAACAAAGIARHRLIVDPGIGFGKTFEHNLALLRGLERFSALDAPLLVGVSRKGFIGKLAGGVPAAERLPGSLVAALFSFMKGASIFRVHDVKETRAALDLLAALAGYI